MKVRLTEQQTLNLLSKLGNIESLLGNKNIDPKEIERLAPNLTQLFKSFTGGGNIPTTEKPGLLNKVKSSILKSAPSLKKSPVLKNIPPGDEPIHPLGKSGKITSGYGRRTSSVGSKNHKGVDIGTPSGSPVYSPLDGEVLESRDTTPNGCGGFIKLDHTNMQTKFCHLRQMVVKRGQKVKKGQLIGYSGGGKNDPMRGTATGPHLHYEVLNKSGIAMNPSSVHPNLA